jgi:ankyrin repeat protein
MEIGQLLIEKCPDLLTCRNKDNALPFHIGAYNGHPDIVSLMPTTQNIVNELCKYSDKDQEDKPSVSALMLAALSGKYDIVQKLLDCGSDTKFQDSDGLTALHMAIEEDFIDIATLLVEHDPELVIVVDKYNWYPLLYAVSFSTPEMIELLLDNGADPNVQNSDGNSALHLAVLSEKTDYVRILLQHKNININLQDNSGFTAHHVSALKGDFQIFKELVDAGADLSLQNKTGSTALDLAKRFENQQIVDYLSQDLQQFSLD